METKIYKFPELKSMCKAQGYKLACMENSQGIKVETNNNIKTNVEKHLSVLESRLKQEIYPDGVYYVCLARTIQQSHNPHKYAICKGKIDKSNLPAINDRVNITTIQPDVLTWEKALEYNQTINELKYEIKRKDDEISALKLENSELLLDVEEEDEPENKGLLGENGILAKAGSFLKEQSPLFMRYLDKHFELKERQLALQENKGTGNGKRQFKKQEIEIGSKEHLAYIELLVKNNNQEQMDIELDKLEQVNPDLYKQVCENLGIETTPENNE